MAAAVKMAQYVTIIDKSNKVIGNSRQFKDVFIEAKVAYQERKAEIKAKKRVKEEEELQKAIRAVSLQDSEAGVLRPESVRRRSSNRPHATRHRSNTSPRSSGNTTPREGATRGISLGEFNEQIYGNAPPAANQYAQPSAYPWDPTYQDPQTTNHLIRARTEQPLPLAPRPNQQPRSYSADEIDMDLAYGEYNPESLLVSPEDARKKELSTLVTRCKGLLDEADCAGHSAKAIIEHLQKNPDTLAAVGLTLAEISSVASKMAPGALAMIGKSAPAVMALLLSPQFLIAVGVGVGVTVIAIGGFKIIKKMKMKGEEGGNARQMGMGPGSGPGSGPGPGYVDEAIDVRELDRVEAWRRGVPESVVDETGSIVSGTTVEGEFISPFAARSMGHLPPARSASGVGGGKSKSGRKSSHSKSGEKDKDTESKKGEHKKKHRRRKSDGETESVLSSGKESSGSGSTIRRSKTEKSVVKVKKPSPLSRMFSTGGSVRS